MATKEKTAELTVASEEDTAPAPEKKRRTKKFEELPVAEAEKEAASGEAVKTEKKARAPKSAPAPTEVYLQYMGGETAVAALAETAKAEFLACNPNTAIRELKLYLKPEDGAAYYVINGDAFGKLAL